MGAVFCCCFRPEDSDDRQQDINTNSFNLSTSDLAQACSNLLLRRQHQPRIISSSSSSSPSPSSTSSNQLASLVTVPHSTTCDTFRSPPTPLPYSDHQCSPQWQHHGLLSKQGKGSSPVGTGKKPNVFETENECKLQNPESSVKKPSEDVIIGIGYTLNSSDEEDSCPICLEDYTDENPCITMLCHHEFHLGCLYEWMERSDDCPICGKVMVFNEAS